MCAVFVICIRFGVRVVCIRVGVHCLMWVLSVHSHMRKCQRAVYKHLEREKKGKERSHDCSGPNSESLDVALDDTACVGGEQVCEFYAVHPPQRGFDDKVLRYFQVNSPVDQGLPRRAYAGRS